MRFLHYISSMEVRLVYECREVFLEHGFGSTYLVAVAAPIELVMRSSRIQMTFAPKSEPIRALGLILGRLVCVGKHAVSSPPSLSKSSVAEEVPAIHDHTLLLVRPH